MNEENPKPEIRNPKFAGCPYMLESVVAALCRAKKFDTSPQPLSPVETERGGRTGVITKHHSHHYFGFAETQWKLFLKESPRRVKPLLYVYRVLLTGIHLMRTGEVEANLVTLNEILSLISKHLRQLAQTPESRKPLLSPNTF